LSGAMRIYRPSSCLPRLKKRSKLLEQRDRLEK
jgi:hypothetical protein